MISRLAPWIPDEAGSSLSVGLLHVVQSAYTKNLWTVSLAYLFDKKSIYYQYKLVRRPRLVLDFAATLVFNHLLLTTYYSAALPTSLFYWLVLVIGAVVTIVFAEQLCVKRVMKEGLQIRPEDEDVEAMEMGGMMHRMD